MAVAQVLEYAQIVLAASNSIGSTLEGLPISTSEKYLTKISGKLEFLL